jgi:hypothetical protein
MGDNDRSDPSIATDGSAQRPPRRLPFWTGVTLAALTVLLCFLFRDWVLNRWRSVDDLDNGFPPGALLDYVPEDSEAVLAVNVRSLLESPVRSRLTPLLQQLIRRGERRLPWMDLLGLNPIDDLDYLQISFAPGTGGEPLWLARDRLDRSRIQIGPDKLQEKTVDHFRVWEYTERQTKRTTRIAPVGDMFVVSETLGRVLSALKHASTPRPIAVRDATLRELLTKVDRRQSLWLAASIKSLGSIAGIEDPILKRVLRLLLAHTESVYGSIACKEDVQVELHFRAATAEGAQRLEADLQSISEAAPGAAVLLGRRKELLPLLRLLESGKTHRDGNEVLLRCELAADQLEG